MTDTKRKDVLENADAFERMVQNLCMVSMRSDVAKQLPHGLREAVDAEIRRPQWTARDLVEEIRRLRRGIAEIGGEWDPAVRPIGSCEVWVADIAERARALLPDTGDE